MDRQDLSPCRASSERNYRLESWKEEASFVFIYTKMFDRIASLDVLDVPGHRSS